MLDCLPAYTLCIPTEFADVTWIQPHIEAPTRELAAAVRERGVEIKQLVGMQYSGPPKPLPDVVKREGWTVTYSYQDLGPSHGIVITIAGEKNSRRSSDYETFGIYFTKVGMRDVVLAKVSLNVGGVLIPLRDLHIGPYSFPYTP